MVSGCGRGALGAREIEQLVEVSFRALPFPRVSSPLPPAHLPSYALAGFQRSQLLLNSPILIAMRDLLGRPVRNLAPRGGPATRRGDSEASPPPPCQSNSTSTTSSTSAKTPKPASIKTCLPDLRRRRHHSRRRPSPKPSDGSQLSAQAIFAAYATKNEADVSSYCLPKEQDLARRHFVLTHQLG